MPEWVSEGSIRKYVRAEAELKKDNADRKRAGKPEVEITEEAIKELYIRYAGLVLGDASTVRGASDVKDALETVEGEVKKKEKARKDK